MASVIIYESFMGMKVADEQHSPEFLYLMSDHHNGHEQFFVTGISDSINLDNGFLKSLLFLFK